MPSSSTRYVSIDPMSLPRPRLTAKQWPQEAYNATMEHGKMEIGDRPLRITTSETPRAI
jgi:hypothetical protein